MDFFRGASSGASTPSRGGMDSGEIARALRPGARPSGLGLFRLADWLLLRLARATLALRRSFLAERAPMEESQHGNEVVGNRQLGAMSFYITYRLYIS